MRTVNYARRCFYEIIRDPLSVIFAVLLPLFLLFIFQQFKIPNAVYNVENFTPGIIIFSFAFISMFTATLVANDRATSLLTRLCASPMKITDYLFGYVFAVLPLVIIQELLFFALALALKLSFSINILWTILVSIPVSLLFIALGILIGCIATNKAASGISSVVVQLVAFTSGMYFDSSMVGKTFNVICNILPFSGCYKITGGVLNGVYDGLLIPIITVSIYIVLCGAAAILLLKKRLEGDHK